MAGRAAARGDTRRMSGIASSPTQNTPPPLASAMGPSFSAVVRTSAYSIGFSGPEAASAVWLPSLIRYNPICEIAAVPMLRPPSAGVRASVEVVPSGAVIVTGLSSGSSDCRVTLS